MSVPHRAMERTLTLPEGGIFWLMADRGALAEASDAELARRVAAEPEGGAPVAEALLFERFGRRVYLYGMRHLRDEEAATDLAQDVMTRVIERLRAGEVREPDRVGSFILGTARMMAMEARRRTRRRAALTERWAADVEARPEAAVEPLDVERLARCMAELPERERAVVVLSFQADQSAAEIGEAMGLTPGNVRVIRHRAIARLQRTMDPAAGEGTREGVEP